MQIRILGSGQAAGLPAWNDGSELASRARRNDPQVPPRRGACIALSVDGLRHSLIEAPFHLAASLARGLGAPPNESAHPVAIDTVLLTAADLDANAGLLALRHGLSARIASSTEVQTALHENDAAFRSLEALWGAYPWDRAFPLDRDGILEARLFPLPGPVPDHLLELAPRAGRGRCGVRVTDTRSGIRLVWAPRIQKLDSATLAELRAADLRFIDGTCYADAEARALKRGAHAAGEIGHLAIDGHQGSLAVLAGMSGRSFYIHMASGNPLCDVMSPENRRLEDAGIERAEDGMEIAF
ncbi:MAG: MBL fold metallo-hydrolase [Myxococcota bacterium]